jgi:hypothetical protein
MPTDGIRDAGLVGQIKTTNWNINCLNGFSINIESFPC